LFSIYVSVGNKNINNL